MALLIFILHPMETDEEGGPTERIYKLQEEQQQRLPVLSQLPRLPLVHKLATA
jgi:hypothetical protein